MEETSAAILELGGLLLGAVAAGWLAREVGLPAAIGYLALGFVVSPFTPGYVADRYQLQLLADVGVVLLLFEVGIEIDPMRLRRHYGRLVWAAPLQVAITTGVGALAGMVFGLGLLPALVIGLAIAMSSSVVIVNITRSSRRTTDPPTQAALLGWSVVQDVVGIVFAAVLIAALSGQVSTVVISVAEYVAFAAVVVAVAVVLPAVLRHVKAQPDLFLLTSVASGLALAGVGSVVFGVPLALAAFVGGLAIAENPVSAQARRQLLPFRDVFAVLFFVAIGALIDPAQLSVGLGWLALFLALIVAAKVLPTYLIARFATLTERPLQLAIGLGQIGEFSFVLAAVLAASGALPASAYVAMIAAVAISIGFSTILVRLVPTPSSVTVTARSA